MAEGIGLAHARHPASLHVPPAASPRRAASERLLTSLFLKAEWAFAAVAIFLFSGAVVQLVLWGGGQSITATEGNTTLRNISISLYLISFGFIAARWKSFLAAMLRDKLHLAFVAFALLSVGWSNLPNLTQQRAIALVLTTMLGWYLGTRFSARTLLGLVGLTFGVAMILSYGAALVFPSYGITGASDGGAWRGVFVMKNSLGKAAALATIALVLLGWNASRHRWVYALGALLSCGLIFMANSKTAVVLVVALLAVLPLLRVLQWNLVRAVPVAACIGVLLCAAALWLVVNLETGLEALDRDVTLTGRVPLWEGILTAGMQRPWFGYGYSAFWIENSEQLLTVQRIAGWRANGGHNGFLELWLELGLVGLLLFLIAFTAAATHVVRLLRRVRTVDMLWPVVFLLFYALGNLTESGLARSNHVLWILYIALVTTARSQLHAAAPEPAQPMSPRGATPAVPAVPAVSPAPHSYTVLP